MKIELCKKVLSGRFSGGLRDSGVQYMRRSEEFVEDEENNDTQTRTSAIIF